MQRPPRAGHGRTRRHPARNRGACRCCWARSPGVGCTRAHRPPPAAARLVLVGYLGHFDVRLARRLFRRTPIVLDHLIGASDTARDRQLSGGIRQVLLRAIDSGALRVGRLDRRGHRGAPQRTACASTATGRWSFRSARRKPGSTPPQMSRLRCPVAAGRTPAPLRVLFFGLYTPLQGTPVIGRALALLAGAPVEATMVGKGQDGPETRRAAAANTRGALAGLGGQPRNCRLWPRGTTCAWASSAPAPRRCASCPTRSSRARRRAARSSPRTRRHSAGCSATPRSSCRRRSRRARRGAAAARRGPRRAALGPRRSAAAGVGSFTAAHVVEPLITRLGEPPARRGLRPRPEAHPRARGA